MLLKKSNLNIIVINAIVFALIYILSILGNTFWDNGIYKYYNLIEFSPCNLFKYPWSLFTYLWIHYDLLHIICNMYVFYLASTVFNKCYVDKNLVTTYIFSGVVIAIIYTLISYILYKFVGLSIFYKPIVGSSSSILFILSASTFFDIKGKINIGKININILMFTAFILILFTLFDFENIGGHFIHIISVISGFVYSKSNIFIQNKNLKICNEYNAVLNKIKYSGFNSLNKKEKQTLVKYRNNVINE